MSTKQKAVDKEGEKDNDSISKLGFEEAKDKHFEQKIGKKFSTVIDTNPIQSSLRVGKLQIGGNVKDLRNFGENIAALVIYYFFHKFITYASTFTHRQDISQDFAPPLIILL